MGSDEKGTGSQPHGWTPIWQTPQGELNAGASMLGEEEVEEVLAVIRSHSLSRDYGPDCQQTVLRFEQEFARRNGSGYALGTISGSTALKIALVAAGVGPGDEVIVPCCTFISSASSVVSAGAVPIFAEIDESLSIDPDDIESKITPRTRAILAAHLYGLPCKIDQVVEIAKRHSLKVIENCALSCGTEYKGRRIGSWGDLGAFSLQIVKVITAGEGGVVTSSDPDLYERAVRFHDQGNYRESSRFPGITPHLDPFAGESYRMTELAGASALRQLEKLDSITGTLRARYRRFREGIASIDGLVPQPVNDEAGHLGVRYGLLFDDAETCKRFSDAVRQEGLSMGLLYGGRPVYMLPAILNQATVTPAASPWKSPLYDGEATYHEGLCARSEETMKRVLQISRINCLYSERDVDEIVSILGRVAKRVL